MKTERVENCTVTVRVHDAELKEKYEEALGEKSMSEDLRDHMRSVADIGQDDYVDLPEHETLRDAVVILREKTGPLNNTISSDEAECHLSSELNIPKNVVKRDVFRRLEEMGYIRPIWGRIIVKDGGRSDE